MKKIALLLIGIFIFTACNGGGEMKAGQEINTSAKITRNTYEHPINPPEGYPYAAYVRLNGEESVLYSKTPVKCKLGQDIEFEGRVRKATAVPEGQEQEATELHVVLKEFECTGEAYEPEASGINVVQIENMFKDKIIYGSGLEEKDPEPYKKDCEARGGTFNECGSPCAPDADICAQVCAYTCEF